MKNVDVNSNISEKKNSMTGVTQSRRIALFSLWSFNQGDSGGECKNICLIFKNIQIFGFPQNFWNSFQNNRSNITSHFVQYCFFEKYVLT